MIRILPGLVMTIFASAAGAQDFSADQLLGRWEFTAYAEASDPDVRTHVGVVYDFREDGALVAELSKGDKVSAYRVDGETVFFIDKRGEQVWHVRNFEPGANLVLIDGAATAPITKANTLIYLERR